MDKALTKRALQKAATRAAVIEAARRVFENQGYDGATIAEIAKAAGVSPGTVLNAAPTKMALLNDVMVADFEALGLQCDRLAASLTSPLEEKVAALLELHLHRHCGEIELIAALLGHSWLEGGAEFESLYRNLDEAWGPIRRLLRERKAMDGLAGDKDPDAIVRVLQDLYIGVIRRCSARGDHDLFAASAEMRRGLDMVFDGVLS